MQGLLLLTEIGVSRLEVQGWTVPSMFRLHSPFYAWWANRDAPCGSHNRNCVNYCLSRQTPSTDQKIRISRSNILIGDLVHNWVFRFCSFNSGRKIITTNRFINTVRQMKRIPAFAPPPYSTPYPLHRRACRESTLETFWSKQPSKDSNRNFQTWQNFPRFRLSQGSEPGWWMSCCWPKGLSFAHKLFSKTVRPRLRNQSRSPWLRFLNP